MKTKFIKNAFICVLTSFAIMGTSNVLAECTATGVEQVKCRIDEAKTKFAVSNAVPAPKLVVKLMTQEEVAAAAGGDDSASSASAGTGTGSGTGSSAGTGTGTGTGSSSNGFTYGQ